MHADKIKVSSRGAERQSNPQPANRGLLRFARNDRVLLAILLLAFALRVWDLADLRMWGDEGFSVYSANRSLSAITFEGKDVDPHPPLYYYLLHFWLPRAGFSEFSIRFLSIFFGTATVALMFTLAKRVFDARIGLLASALIALAPFAIHYSQEVRMYALVIFLGALATYFFAQLIAKESRARWLGFWIAMLLAQYTLYQTAFLFIAQGLALLPFLKNRFALVVRWFIASVSIVILFLPWLALHSASAYTDVKGVAGDTLPMDVWTFLARGFAGLILDPTVPFANALPLAALFFGLIVIGLAIALATRAGKLADAMLVWFIILPLTAMYPLYILLPLYRGRLFALALVPLILLIARAFDLLARRTRWWSAPVAIALIAAMLFGLNHYYFRYNRYSAVVDDYLPAIRALEKIAQPGDVILFHAYWQEGYFLSHYAGAPLTYGDLEKPNDLQNATASARNVWAIVQAIDHHAAEDWLAQNAFPLGEQKYGQMRVLAYRAGIPGRGQDFAEPITFNNGMELRGYRVNDAPIESGRGFATIQLDWGAPQTIARDYTISARLANLRGDVIWVQADHQPASGTRPTSTWQAGQTVRDHHALAIPPGTPPGEYVAQIVVYDSQTGNVANVIAPENRRPQTVMLGSVSVRASSQSNSPAILNPFDFQWNEIALVGFARGADAIAPGDALPLALYWRARQKPTRDYAATIQLLDSSGAVRASLQHRPTSDAFPTSRWNAGETWLDKIILNVDAEATNGAASVRVALDGRTAELTRVQINARAHRFDLPSPQFPKSITLGNAITLLGFDLDADALKSRTTIPLTLYWQAREKISERYTVFAHLLDAQGDLVAQRDSEPDAGNAPTTSWLKNEVIVDRVEIELPANLAPGEYTLIVGMYHAPTGARLVASEIISDRIVLTKIRLPAR